MGRVRSYKKREKGGWVISDTPQSILKPYASKVLLSNSQSRKFASIHILVARAFLGDPPEGMFVFTRDGNRLNCRASNLVYKTKEVGLARMTNETILEIRQRAFAGEQYESIALSLGIEGGCARNCAIGKTYKSFPGPISTKRKLNRPRRFTDEQVRSIRQRSYRGEETQREIAKRLGVSESLISRIVNKKRYTDVKR